MQQHGKSKELYNYNNYIKFLFLGESFGFNIVGGTDSREFGNNSSIFISSINTYGPAASSRQLDVGDKLLQVGGYT